MDIGLMVEGQNGLTWERWLHIVHLAERLGFPSLFRSDHLFLGEQRDSLEAYVSLAVAARETSRIRFGPLVSPVTFRSPVDVARMAAQIDLLSGGRFVVGVGNGWSEAEHRAYGIPFPSPGERSRRLEEAIQVMRALWGPGPASFSGHYYSLDNADALPKPAAGRPYLLIGGSGPKRTLAMVARYADEWNTVNTSAEALPEHMEILARHCEGVDRDPASIKRSAMMFALVGPDEPAIDRVARKFGTMFGREQRSAAEVRASARERGMIVGGTQELVDRLGRLADLGIDEVQLQHVDFDDDELPEYLASEVAPPAKGL